MGLPLSLIFFQQVRAGKPVGGLLSPAGYAGTFPVTILLMYAGSYVATFILNFLSAFRGEALGGEVSADREFNGEPYYESLKKMK